jgi:hypothetical protein
MSKPILTIAIVTKNEIYALTSACILSLSSNIQLNGFVVVVQSFCLGRSDLPKSRSVHLDSWYNQANKNDIFLFIDSDQVFSVQDVLQSLYFLKKYDVVCGGYPRADGRLTLEPKNIDEFYSLQEGEIFYGATGFMMITYTIVDKIAQYLQKPIAISDREKCYAFFFERVIKEEDFYGQEDLWLGEDYSFCWLVRQIGGKIYGYFSSTLGHIITSEKFFSPVHWHTWPDKSIVIYCGGTVEEWSAQNLQTGIGGSETAVIKLASYWQKAGYKVSVFCQCDFIGVHDGVVYHRHEGFRFTDTFDILIIWRKSELLSRAEIKARQCYLDLHDIVNSTQINDQIIENVTKICVKSKFHRNLLPNVPDEKIVIIPNGGAAEFREEIKKDPNYIIYTSSYDRGLAFMLQWGWPVIKEACPNAVMKIFYGWKIFDKIQPKTEDVFLFKKTIVDLMHQDGIEECGRISGQELMRERCKANVHYYVGDFLEIDCISVRESASVGTIPVVSDSIPVFEEKPYCIRITGDPSKKTTQIAAANKIIELIQESEETEKIRSEMTGWENETWECIAQRWLQMFSK